MLLISSNEKNNKIKKAQTVYLNVICKFVCRSAVVGDQVQMHTGRKCTELRLY